MSKELENEVVEHTETYYTYKDLIIRRSPQGYWAAKKGDITVDYDMYREDLFCRLKRDYKG